MRTWLNTLISVAVCSLGLPVLGAPVSDLQVSAAIHAIQQAADPSAAVAAYANGISVSRTNPAIQEAYIVRMIDFGLPELAYHQAQDLVSRVPDQGLAWGVLAYVDARRGDMLAAVSAINLAAQYSPSNAFVQRTAGEIVAWSDQQGATAQLSGEQKAVVEKVRGLLASYPSYISAYNTAKKAYQAQAASSALPAPPSSVAPTAPETFNPQAMVTEPSAPAPEYYPYSSPLYPYSYSSVYPNDYSQLWALQPGWEDYWWWRPSGYFSGVYFVPYPYVVFARHGHRHREGWDRFEHGHDHDRLAGGGASHSWHHDQGTGTSFFGAPASPNPVLAQRSGESAPSWRVFSGTPRSADRRGSQTGHATVPLRPTAPSWSALGTPTERPVYSPAPGTVPRAPRVSNPGKPSWSGLGLGSPRPAPAAPRISVPRTPAPPTPSPAPSWSGFGNGGGAVRSGGGAASGGPSWSGFGNGK